MGICCVFTLAAGALAQTRSRGPDYSQFSHRTEQHKQACGSCHTFPSKNWKEVRNGDDAFPDVTQYPEHQACLTCQAIPWLERAVKADGGMLPARSSLGRALMQTGKGEAAVAHLEKALPVDNDGSLRFQLARAYQVAGRREEAAATMAEYQKIQQELQTQKEQLAEEIQITAPE
jgi:tetratricopeptide (TPR) repeat protein